MTEWRDIPGYKYPYRISSEGEVQQFSRGKWRALAVKVEKGIRAEVRLRTIDGKQVHRGVLRLLDEHFRRGYARKHGLCVCPKNGVKSECTLDNIVYRTQSEIGRDSLRRTMSKPIVRYDKNGNTKLYKSVKDAAKDAGMPHQTLNWRMYHGVLDPRGYRWEVER